MGWPYAVLFDPADVPVARCSGCGRHRQTILVWLDPDEADVPGAHVLLCRSCLWQDGGLELQFTI